jgi:hypothetical protein
MRLGSIIPSPRQRLHIHLADRACFACRSHTDIPHYQRTTYFHAPLRYPVYHLSQLSFVITTALIVVFKYHSLYQPNTLYQ